MPEISETVNEAVEREQEAHSRLNSAVAIFVALTATFMALCNIKDGNINQGMQQALSMTVDTWSYYQARSVKQHLAEVAVDELQTQRALAPPAMQAMFDAKIKKYAEQAAKENTEKKKLQKQAEDYQKQYDTLNFHDDQFDMSEALLSVSIAMFGITALTRKRWLIFVAIIFMIFGTVMGLAGFFGWAIHPNSFAKFLS